LEDDGTSAEKSYFGEKNVVGLQVTKTMQLTEAKELTTKLCVINKKN